MEQTNTLLWLIVILIAGGMTSVLTFGWLKGLIWEREMRLRSKKRRRHLGRSLDLY